MSNTGANRLAYAKLMTNTDPRPSRFRDPLAYRDWTERADCWAAWNGLDR